MCFLSNLTELSCMSAGYSHKCTSFLLIFVETHAQSNQHLLISIRRIVNAVSGWNLHLNSEPPFFWFAFLVWRPRCSHTSCLHDALRAFILTALAWRWENHNACNTLNNSFQQIATPTLTYSLLLLLFVASSRLVVLEIWPCPYTPVCLPEQHNLIKSLCHIWWWIVKRLSLALNSTEPTNKPSALSLAWLNFVEPLTLLVFFCTLDAGGFPERAAGNDTCLAFLFSYTSDNWKRIQDQGLHGSVEGNLALPKICDFACQIVRHNLLQSNIFAKSLKYKGNKLQSLQKDNPQVWPWFTLKKLPWPEMSYSAPNIIYLPRRSCISEVSRALLNISILNVKPVSNPEATCIIGLIWLQLDPASAHPTEIFSQSLVGSKCRDAGFNGMSEISLEGSLLISNRKDRA